MGIFYKGEIFVDYKEVCRYLEVAKCTVTRMIRRGDLKAQKMKGDCRVFITLRSLLDYNKVKTLDLSRLAMKVAVLEERIEELSNRLEGKKNEAPKVSMEEIDELIRQHHL